MPRIGISITKATPFRNSVQEFSNVYYYNSPGSLPSSSEAEGIIDDLVVAEKAWHSTTATFIRGRLWSETGNKETSEMLHQKTLSGTGTLSDNASMDRERAYLFRLRAGNDSRGNPVYLRKWYHSCGQFPGGPTIVTGILGNITGFNQAQRDAMAAAMDGIEGFSDPSGDWVLCSKAGRIPDPSNHFQCHQFLEHHQFGNMWRAV